MTEEHKPDGRHLTNPCPQCRGPRESIESACPACGWSPEVSTDAPPKKDSSAENNALFLKLMGLHIVISLTYFVAMWTLFKMNYFFVWAVGGTVVLGIAFAVAFLRLRNTE